MTIGAACSPHAGQLGVAAHLEGAEALLERVVGEQPADERVAEVEDELDRLERLDRPDDAGQHPEDARFGAARCELGRGRLGEQAAVAGTLVGLEHRDLTFEPEDRAVHDGHAGQQRRVVEQIAGGEVVGAVDDDVVALEDVEDVVGAEADVVGDDVDVGVQLSERLLRRVDLALADPVDVVEHLALQVRRVHHVHVDDAERPDARRGEVERGGGAEPAGAEEQDLALEQLLLPGFADLGQQQVTVIAVPLVGAEHRRGDPGRVPRSSNVRTHRPSTSTSA